MSVLQKRKTVHQNRFRMRWTDTDNVEHVDVVELERAEGNVYSQGTLISSKEVEQAVNLKQDTLSAGENVELVNEGGNCVISIQDYKPVDCSHIAPKLPSAYSVDYANWTYTPPNPGMAGTMIKIPYRSFNSADISFEIGNVLSEGTSKIMAFRFLDIEGSGNYTLCQYNMNSHILYFARKENGAIVINTSFNSVNFDTFRVVRATCPDSGYEYQFFNGEILVCRIETTDTDKCSIEFGTMGFDAEIKFWKIRG